MQALRIRMGWIRKCGRSKNLDQKIRLNGIPRAAQRWSVANSGFPPESQEPGTTHSAHFQAGRSFLLRGTLHEFLNQNSLLLT